MHSTPMQRPDSFGAGGTLGDGELKDAIARFNREIDAAELFGEMKHEGATNGGEFSRDCPKCGTGIDRLRVWPNRTDGGPVAWCRQCETSGDVLKWAMILEGRDPTAKGATAEFLRAKGCLASRTNKSNPVHSTKRKSTTARPAKNKAERRAFDSASEAIDFIRPHVKRDAGADEVETQVWSYLDSAGVAVMQVVRFNLTRHNVSDERGSDRTDKTYRPIHLASDGKWRLGDPPGPLPLYRLPELIANASAENPRPVFVSEGEKAADAAARLGLVSTTTAHGAKSPQKSDLSPLAGADVVLLPDNDDAGTAYVKTLAGMLQELQPPARVRIVKLPGLREGGDIFDFVELERQKVTTAVGESGNTMREEDEKNLVDCIRSDVEGQASSSPYLSAEGVNEAAGGPEQSTGLRQRETEFGTELWTARLLARKHGRDLRYVELWGKWAVWCESEGRWRFDLYSQVMQRAEDVGADVRVEALKRAEDAANAGDEGGGDAAAHFRRLATKYEARRPLENVIALTGLEHVIASSHDIFDRDPRLLCVENGTVDLRTGALREHTRDDFITKRCAVPLMNVPPSNPWTNSLTIILPDVKVRDWFQRFIGCCATGLVRDDIFGIAYGPGGTGKSTVFGAIAAVLGDYAGQAAHGLLTGDSDRQHPEGLADLFGRRLVLLAETKEGARLDVNLIKRLTGGDNIKARRMRENSWEFPPTHKLVVYTNHKPRVSGTDSGFWRRARLIPFTTVLKDVLGGKHDPIERDLFKTDPERRTAVLAWIVEGAVRYYTEGLSGVPDAVRLATEEYRSDEDIIGQFLAECVTIGGDSFSATSEVFRAYKTWAEANGHQPVGQRTFSSDLADRGHKTYPLSGVRGIRGLELKSGVHVHVAAQGSPNTATFRT